MSRVMQHPEIAHAAPLEGMAEGSGLEFEEVVLIALNEELYHLGMVPPIGHCTVLAAGPPDTGDSNTYVGQNSTFESCLRSG